MSDERVNHGDMPSLAYRVVTPDLDVVFSGDRGDELTRFAAGADVLFHEISDLELAKAALEAQGAPPRYVDTSSTITRAALVLYHLVPGSPAITDDRWRWLVAAHFAGEIVVGRDLLALPD